MTINPIYSIGQRVKVYENTIKNSRVSNVLSLYTDTVVSIVIMKNILTNEEFYMYKLENRDYLFHEKTLMKQYS